MRKVSITWFLCLSIPGLLLPIHTTTTTTTMMTTKATTVCVLLLLRLLLFFRKFYFFFYIVWSDISEMFHVMKQEVGFFRSLQIGCHRWFSADGFCGLRLTICLAADIHWLPIILQWMKLLGHFHSMRCLCIGDRRSTTVLAWSLFMQKFANVVDVALHVRTCHFWPAFRMGECSRIQFNFDHPLPGSLTISIHLSLSPSVAG